MNKNNRHLLDLITVLICGALGKNRGSTTKKIKWSNRGVNQVELVGRR